MQSQNFDRNKHVYKNDAFVELIKDAVRFFNGTPVHTLPPPEKFSGVGVYAIYYTGKNPIYKKYSELNRLSYDFTIYVGKAVPSGWRQSRKSHSKENKSTELFSRIRQHSNSITASKNINLEDFSCRFVIFENDGSDMIGSIEASLIKLNRPLWNSALDGFGNHDPGKGRYEQANSDWDVIHKGRPFAEKLKGTPTPIDRIMLNIKNHLDTLKKI